ncbi:MAG: PAS domain S-box protein [Pseudomonadota bacterium]
MTFAQPGHYPLRDLLRHAPLVLWCIDRHGVFTVSEGGGLATLGLSPGEVVGRSLFDIYAGDPVLIAAAKRALAGERFSATSTAQNRSWETRYAPMTDTAGAMTGAIGVAIDISEQALAIEALNTSEAQFRQLVEALPESIIIHQDGRIVYANPCGAAMLGADAPAALTGRPIGDFFPPETRAPAAGRPVALETPGKVLPIQEQKIRRQDGTIIPIETRAIPYVYLGYPAVLTMSRDISDRRQIEIERDASREQFRGLFDSMTLGVVYQDPAGRILAANPAARNILGVSPADLAERSAADARWQGVAENGQPLSKSDYPSMRALDTGQPVRNAVIGVNCADTGQRRWLLVDAVPEYRLDEQAPYRTFTTFSDITDMKRIEKAFRQSEERFRRIVDNSPMGIHTYRLDGAGRLIFTGANPAADSILGVDHNQFTGKTIETAFPNLIETEIPQRYRDVIRKGSPWKTEQTDYADHQIQGAFVIYAFKTGPDAMAVMFRDITGRKQTEAALKESESRFKALFEFAPDAYYLSNLEGRFLDGNKASEQLIGYSKEELIGSSFLELSILPMEEVPKAAALLKKNINGEPAGPEEIKLIRKDGTHVFAEIISLPIDIHGEKTILGIARNISDRKQAELEQLHFQTRMQLVQKMEALGSLAGGIAHDFNNILAAIMGYSEIALADAPAGSPIRANMEKVLQAGTRASDLVKQILAFSRQSDIEPRPVKVRLIIKEVLTLLRPTLPATIEIRQDATTDATVMADPTQIHQVLMNLCANAAHAMAEAGGMLGIALSERQVGAADVAHIADLKPGRHLCLSVSDTGHGIAPEALDRIFDPFFTTKKKGEGTGMGLSVVHGIVKSHHGAITVHSTPGVGTRFDILLPIIDSGAPDAVITPAPLPGGTESILFVDDEPFQVDIGAQILSRLGYRVTARTDPREALTVFRHNPAAIDLVISDMTMPGMTGDVLARELIAIRPDIPIIICTGYSERISEETATTMGIRGFAMKPVVMKNVAELVRKVLDEK